LVGTGVGPFSEHGLDEAFGLAVGARGVGPRKSVFDVLLERHAEASVAVAGAVVGKDATDREAEAWEVSACSVEEELCRGAGLVGQDGGEANAAVVVDGDMQVLIADATSLPSAVAVNTMAGFDDPRQTLDVKVDEAARALVFVAHHGRRRIERTQPVHAGPAQDTAHRGATDSHCLGDPPTVVA